ncbi:MAG: hypothetical protein JWO53_658 [Chlamydiia bacterium]|nr:hypothetical protein [Chlamydiia bacterium]
MGELQNTLASLEDEHQKVAYLPRKEIGVHIDKLISKAKDFNEEIALQMKAEKSPEWITEHLEASKTLEQLISTLKEQRVAIAEEDPALEKQAASLFEGFKKFDRGLCGRTTPKAVEKEIGEVVKDLFLTYQGQLFLRTEKGEIREEGRLFKLTVSREQPDQIQVIAAKTRETSNKQIECTFSQEQIVVRDGKYFLGDQIFSTKDALLEKLKEEYGHPLDMKLTDTIPYLKLGLPGELNDA